MLKLVVLIQVAAKKLEISDTLYKCYRRKLQNRKAMNSTCVEGKWHKEHFFMFCSQSFSIGYNKQTGSLAGFKVNDFDNSSCLRFMRNHVGGVLSYANLVTHFSSPERKARQVIKCHLFEIWITCCLR